MTTQTIVAAVQKAIDLVGAVDGIRYAPDYPPEEIGDYFPAVTGYISEFNASTITSDFDQKIFTIVIELHVARQGDLPREVEKAMPYADSIPDMFMDDQTLDGTVSHFERVRGTFGALNYGDTKTLGFKFFLEGVKIH